MIVITKLMSCYKYLRHSVKKKIILIDVPARFPAKTVRSSSWKSCKENVDS